MIIDRIQINDDGTLHVRIRKSDGGWHRTVIPPGTDPVAQMAAVNRHLAQMGCKVVPAAGIAAVCEKCAELHAPERVAAFRATQRMRHEEGGQLA